MLWSFRLPLKQRHFKLFLSRIKTESLMRIVEPLLQISANSWRTFLVKRCSICLGSITPGGMFSIPGNGDTIPPIGDISGGVTPGSMLSLLMSKIVFEPSSSTSSLLDVSEGGKDGQCSIISSLGGGGRAIGGWNQDGTGRGVGVSPSVFGVRSVVSWGRSCLLHGWWWLLLMLLLLFGGPAGHPDCHCLRYRIT